MQPDRFLTHSLTDARIARILSAALDAVEPGRIVRDYLTGLVLPPHERVFLLGVGKAAEPMTFAAAEALPDFAAALVITKHAVLPPAARIQVMEAAHPVPDARSVMAGRAALDFASHLTDKDLLLCLISGGASALATSPRTGVGLRDIQLLTNALLAAGAGIEDVNTVRRHLDAFKGGGLARATRARVYSLLISDVIGDRLEVIASGPTAPDPTSGADALAVLSKYAIQAPPAVYSVLSGQRSSGGLESHATNVVIANSNMAASAARAQAEQDGFSASILRTDLQGEARLMGPLIARRLRSAAAEHQRPLCLIAGGETTVTIQGTGRGGRNQELALSAVEDLDGLQDVLLVSLATDGDDGPTDAAGAVVSGDTAARARAAGLSAESYLASNDSYSYFDALGDLLKPGYTGTNVNDLIFLFAL